MLVRDAATSRSVSAVNVTIDPDGASDEPAVSSTQVGGSGSVPAQFTVTGAERATTFVALVPSIAVYVSLAPRSWIFPNPPTSS